MEDYEKELLLRDLGTRLVGGVYCQVDGVDEPVKLLSIHADHVDGILLQFDSKDEDGHILEVYVSEVKPYLRSMDNMTEEEEETFKRLKMIAEEDGTFEASAMLDDWLDDNHFDRRLLIYQDLAIEAPEKMYKDN